MHVTPPALVYNVQPGRRAVRLTVLACEGKQQPQPPGAGIRVNEAALLAGSNAARAPAAHNKGLCPGAGAPLYPPLKREKRLQPQGCFVDVLLPALGSSAAMESMVNSVQKRVAELEHMAELLITGEQLRLRLHEEKVIKDRRHHLKTYPNCFVAKELIDWLIDRKEATDRETAVKLVQKLFDSSIIHHVCDELKEFKDVKLFYRFRKDDGTFPMDNEVKVFMRGQRLYEKLMMNTESTILQPREEEGVKYDRAFMASDFVDWLIQEGEVTTRAEAEQLGRRLLEHGIIQHDLICLVRTQ